MVASISGIHKPPYVTGYYINPIKRCSTRVIVKAMMAYCCHHLSDNYVDLSDLYIDLPVIYVDLSDHYVDLSEKYHYNY